MTSADGPFWSDRNAAHDAGHATPPGVGRATLLSALTLAIDLGLGLPAEHVMRSAFTARLLSRAMGQSAEEQITAFHTTLVMWIGCHADSFEYARWFGDDIAARRNSYRYDWAGLPYAWFLATNTGRGQGALRRAATTAALASSPRRQISTLVASHCSSATVFAHRLGLGAAVEEALGYTYERWDGRGGPAGISGAEIPVATRIAQTADTAEAKLSEAGVRAAVEHVRGRAGGQLDPDIAAVFVAHAADILVGDDVDIWHESATLDASCALPSIDEMAKCLAAFVDVKSPWTLGHSEGVAQLAAAAARHCGGSPSDVALLRRAGWLHDLGRIGVSNQVWDKSGQFTSADRERVQMHPFLTTRILTHLGIVPAEAQIAGNHHERLDGSGYPHGLSGSRLTLPDQLLAAADLFHTALEPRPHRRAVTRAAAAEHLASQAAQGLLSGDAVTAVLTAAGERRGSRRAWPDGLTNREVDVLRGVARANTTAQIAAHLGIASKTVRNHLDHVFAKTGATNRVGLSLYALEHGLIDP